MSSQTHHDRLDQATARRLAKLREMPVDTSRLDRLIESRIPPPHAVPDVVFRLRPLRAAAAAVALLAIVGAMIWSLSGGAAQASPQVLAQFHEELVSGKIPAIRVDSIAQANQALAEQWKQAVQIPEIPSEHVIFCCMRQIQDKRVACVLLRGMGDVPVTMAVAKARDMKMSGGEIRAYKGLLFHIYSSGRLNMAMTERDGRWICLISQLPVENLMEIAGEIRF